MNFASLCKRILIPLFLPYSLFIGCSVVGGVVGGVTHPARPGRITSPLGLDSIETGRQIRLVRYDRSTLDGTFNGLAVDPDTTYAVTYDTLVARSAYRGFVPALNQKITLVAAGKFDDGFFKGIDRGQLLFQPASGSDTIGVSLEDIDRLQGSDSLRLEGRTLRQLVRDGSMPGRRVILLAIDREVRRVPCESIDIVQVKRSAGGALTGFLIGAAVDITVAALILFDTDKTESDLDRSAPGCNYSDHDCTRTHR